MKCVGLFFFVLLVQLFMSPRWRKELHDNGIADELSQAAERAYEIIKNKPHEKLNYDDFRSKLNTTEGIFIPSNLLLTSPLNDASSNVLTAFRGLQQTLTDLSTCPSKIVSSVSTHLFALLDKKANKFGSLSEDGSSLSNVISEVFSSINDVITSLDVGTGINDGVSKIESGLLNVIQVLGEAKSSDSNITKKLNDAVFSVAKSVQVLINSISALAEGATVNVAVSNEAKEAIISLTLILQTTIVFVQSVGLSIASITLSISGRITPASSVLNSFLEILDRQLPLMTNFLSSVTSESLATSVSAIVSTLSVTLISVSYRINQLLEKLQTGVLLQVSNKLELTLYRLIGAEADFISYITTSAVTVSSSISAISSSDLGIQSKTSRILYALIQNLMQLTGSDSEIAENFANSLSGIFEIFKVVSTNIVFAIGAELTNSIIKSIEDVFTALQKMADLLIKDKFDSVKMDNVAIECAKAVQVLGSIVIALTRSISSSMDSVSDVVLESVISLPIIHSTVLYVAEWVTVVASSVSLTKLGQTHDLVSSLAVTIVAILKHISSIVEIIAVSSTQPSIEIFSLILSPILDFTKSMASINRISQVDAKISVKVEASAGKGSEAFVIDGINTTAERTVSEHLNGLTGSLNSISSSFSSSLSNLRISLKRIATLEFGLLQTFSVTLNSVTTNLENISGSATQILNVTFKSLNSIFGRLLDSASKLTNLGSLVSSLVKSIINVSTALHSLRYAINDYRGSICYLNDSIRELAKNVQILISTFVAVIRSSASASSDIIDKLAVEVASLPYLIFTVVLVVQQVLGAAILSASTINGSIPLIQHELAVALSSVLDSLAFITTEVTVLLTGGSLNEIASKILTSVTDLQDSATASLSKISGVKANIDVTLGLANQEPVA